MNESSVTDIVSEEVNSGFDYLMFDTPYGIVADLSPQSTSPSVMLRSPYRVQRYVKFQTPAAVLAFERISGTSVADQFSVDQNMSIQGKGGNDMMHVAAPLLPGQGFLIQQLSHGLAVRDTDTVNVTLTASAGTLRLARPLPTGLVANAVSATVLSVSGASSVLNNFLLGSGIRLVAPATFVGRIQVTLDASSPALPAKTERDQLSIDVTWRPIVTTGGLVSWVEHSPAAVLAPLAELSDQDDNLSGGSLQVSSSAIVDAADDLVIMPHDPGMGPITLQNDRVLFDGVVVATWSFDSVTQRLTVTFGPNASRAAARAILRQIAFTNDAANPLIGTRSIKSQMIDGAGMASAVATTTVNVLQSNPTIPLLTGVATPTQLLRPRLTWTPISGAVSYDIWIRNATTQQNPYHLASSDVPSYSPPGDFGIGLYNIWLRAVMANGQKSAWSPRVDLTITTPVIVNPIAFRQTVSRPTISWNALPGAVRYDLWIDNAATGQSQVIRETALTGTSWTPTANLTMGTYRVWVRGFDAAGVGTSWSVPQEFMVVPAPVAISPIDATFNRTPEFQWTAVTGAARYQILLRNPNTGTTVFQEFVTTNFFVAPARLSDGPYRWQVRALGPQGQSSEFFAAVRIYVGGQPQIFAPIGTSTSIPTFVWSAVQGAATYQLRVDRTDPLQVNRINVSGLTTNRYTATTPLPAGTYRFWVRAASTSGEVGIWSSLTVFTVASSESNTNSPADDDLHPLIAALGQPLLVIDTFRREMRNDHPSIPNKEQSSSTIGISEAQRVADIDAWMAQYGFDEQS